MQEFTIRDVTKITRLSRTTVLYYESKGLITPHFADESDYRLYYLSDISKILFFQNLKNLGVSVQEYAEILKSGHCEGKDVFDLILQKKTAFVRRTLALMNMWDETLALSHHLRNRNSFEHYQYSRDMWVLPLGERSFSPALLDQWDEHFLTRNICYFYFDDSGKCDSDMRHGISCFDENAIHLTSELRANLILLPSRYCLTRMIPFDIDRDQPAELLEALRRQTEADGYAPTGRPWAHCGYRDDSSLLQMDYLTLYQPVEQTPR